MWMEYFLTTLCSYVYLKTVIRVRILKYIYQVLLYCYIIIY